MSRKSILATAFVALAAATSAQAQTATVVQQDCLLQVFFPNGASTLNAAQIREIEAFTEGGTGVRIVGYSSSVGSAAANQALSTNRANRVGSVMQASGSGQITLLQGRGEAGSGAQFRRVDVVRDGCVVAGIPGGAGGAGAAGGAAGAGAGAGGGALLAAGGLGPAAAAIGGFVLLGVMAASSSGTGDGDAVSQTNNP